MGYKSRESAQAQAAIPSTVTPAAGHTSVRKQLEKATAQVAGSALCGEATTSAEHLCRRPGKGREALEQNRNTS